MPARFARSLFLCLTLCGAGAWPTAAAQTPEPERLLGRLAPAYSYSGSFVPALLRYPLTRDPAETYRLAKAEAGEEPADLDAQRRAALAAEAAELNDAATEHWRTALGLVEARLRAAKDRKDPALLELHVEALVGADAAIRAVPAGEALRTARPGDWRAHLLAADAFLRRADFNWRVLVRRAQGSKDLPPQPLLQLNSDLEAAAAAYDRAVELAPAEGAPRGGRIALRLARPLMASLLPQGAVRAEARPDVGAVRADLADWVARSRPRAAPVWFFGLYLATQVGAEVTPAERTLVEGAVAGARAEGDEALFAREAAGLLAVARGDWAGGRAAFEAALAAAPGRAFAAEWLAVAEANSDEPREQVLARVRARAGEAGTGYDWTLIGMLTGESARPQAVAALRKAVSLDVDNPNARYNLALLLLAGNPASLEARHHLRRALEIRGDDREARLAYAVTLVLDGHHKEARATLDSLLRLYELDPKLKARIEATREDIPAPPLPGEVRP